MHVRYFGVLYPVLLTVRLTVDAERRAVDITNKHVLLWSSGQSSDSQPCQIF
jgi:hypothetical protein